MGKADVKARFENQVIDTRWDYSGVLVPIEIKVEFRKSTRVSIGGQKVFLKIPSFMSNDEKQSQLKWCHSWLVRQFQKKPSLLQRFISKEYTDGQILQVGAHAYRINFDPGVFEKSSARLKNGIITLKLAAFSGEEKKRDAIKYLLSRIIAKDRLPELETRVRALNDEFFKKTINSVKIKYNSSNWGSCSSHRNINLSSKLLFAPQEVIDYVIIHELAHLIEMNHSDKFWQLVQNIMPDYPSKEKWLKVHGHECDF